MLNIKKILLILRLVQNNRETLERCIDLAKDYKAELIVLRPYSLPVDLGAAVNAPGLSIEGEEYKNYLSTREQYKDELDKAIHHVTRGGFPIREFVTGDDPVKETLRLVKEEKVDLIVLPAREEGRLEHWLFGGENDALIRKLPCPILLVKQEPQQVPYERPL